MYLIAINGNFGSSQVTEISPLAFPSFHEATAMADIVLSHQKERIQEILTRHSIHAPLTIEVAVCLATPTPNGIAISQIESLTYTINPKE